MGNCMSGVCQTVLDGLKDAEMQLGWAADAKADGNAELAQLHAEEAKKRLSGAKEWYERGMRLYGSSAGAKPDALTALLIEREREHYRDILDRANNFKAGA